MELVVWTGSNALTGFQRAVVSATARPLRARLVFKSRFPHAPARTRNVQCLYKDPQIPYATIPTVHLQ